MLLRRRVEEGDHIDEVGFVEEELKWVDRVLRDLAMEFGEADKATHVQTCLDARRRIIHYMTYRGYDYEFD